jgi:phage tail protein X
LFIGLGALAPAQQLESTTTFGGSGGDGFTDFQPPADTRIVEVRIRSGDTVDALQMVYSLPNGRTVTGPRHGGTGGRQSTFRLDANEYVTGISGRFGDTIDSIRIHTSRRTSPTYGGRGGSRDFRADVPSGNQAVGFTGRAGDTVDAIGLVYSPLQRSSWFSNLGGSAQGGQTSTAGGSGGSVFSDRPPQGARLVEVRVRAGDAIDSIQAIYIGSDGRLIDGARHGGSGGNENTFRLDPGEYLTGLSGRFGDTVDSLRLHTNRRTSPLYGGHGGRSEEHTSELQSRDDK